MGKRFTDTDVYDDPWYIELTAGQKLFWEYLLRKCDAAGVWKVNKPMAEFCTGTRIDLEEILGVMGDRIQVIDGGAKWWVRGFCEFQYGKLSPNCPPHKKVLSILEKNNLSLGYSKGTLRVSDTLQEEEEDKEKDKEEEKAIFTDDEFQQILKIVGIGAEIKIDHWAQLHPKEEIINATMKARDKSSPFAYADRILIERRKQGYPKAKALGYDEELGF